MKTPNFFDPDPVSECVHDFKELSEVHKNALSVIHNLNNSLYSNSRNRDRGHFNSKPVLACLCVQNYLTKRQRKYSIDLNAHNETFVIL